MLDVDTPVEIRPARTDDVDDVVSFTEDTWEGGDYIPQVFEDWVAADDDTQRTFVADRDGRAVGLVQFSLVSEYEAWSQGMRVAPEARGEGVGQALNAAGFEWAREQGATVARNMIFSWNVQGLGLARAIGFEPVASFRWTYPEADASATTGASVVADPDAAWTYWTDSETRSALAGLALDTEESWCLSELRRERLARAATDDGLVVIQDGGTAGFAYRTRLVDREHEGEEVPHAEYGVAAWRDLEAARELYAAIRQNAAEAGADRCRVLVPEDPIIISDSAAARVDVGEEPDFVCRRDLTDIGD
jgi:GNAT superfamily N-acetyltransferase